MVKESPLYYPYSDYLKNKYGEKVYKLPINLPITCPNRLNGKRGCSFCAECGTGFESLDAVYTVTEQLAKNQEHIAKKYKIYYYKITEQMFRTILERKRIWGGWNKCKRK